MPPFSKTMSDSATQNNEVEQEHSAVEVGCEQLAVDLAIDNNQASSDVSTELTSQDLLDVDASPRKDDLENALDSDMFNQQADQYSEGEAYQSIYGLNSGLSYPKDVEQVISYRTNGAYSGGIGPASPYIGTLDLDKQKFLYSDISFKNVSNLSEFNYQDVAYQSVDPFALNKEIIGEALFMLGESYETGNGRSIDQRKAFLCYLHAGRNLHAEAQYRAAHMIFSGVQGLMQPDRVKAFGWLEQAALQGLPAAMYELALHYRDGVIVPQDRQRFIEWLRKSVYTGYAPARIEAELLYDAGEISDSDMDMGFVFAANVGGYDSYVESVEAMKDADFEGVPLDKLLDEDGYTLHECFESMNVDRFEPLEIVEYDGHGNKITKRLQACRKTGDYNGGVTPEEIVSIERVEPEQVAQGQDATHGATAVTDNGFTADGGGVFDMGAAQINGEIQGSLTVQDSEDELLDDDYDLDDVYIKFSVGNIKNHVKVGDDENPLDITDLMTMAQNEVQDHLDGPALNQEVSQLLDNLALQIRKAGVGDVEAQIAIGQHYQEGLGFNLDKWKAEQWFKHAAFAGCEAAGKLLAALYFRICKDQSNAAGRIRYLVKAAYYKDVEALYDLALMLLDGCMPSALTQNLEDGANIQVDSNYALALDCLKEAAAQNSADAQALLGELYKEGTKITQNDILSFYYFMQAADKDVEFAKYNVAECYELGKGVNQDYGLALQWYNKVDPSLSHVRIAWMYFYGHGVPMDKQEAFKYFLSAAEHGNTEALFSVGYMYLHGNGVMRDDAKAIYWLQKSVEHNDRHAQYELGCCYLNGLGVEQNVQEGINLLLCAANQGNICAQYTLGMTYLSGEYIAQNIGEAMRWLVSAGKLGWAEAQYELGQIFICGISGEVNYELARMWLNMAVHQGHIGATSSMAWLLENGYGGPRDDSEAFRLYSMAAKHKDPQALNGLGCMYQEGRAIHEDLSMAKTLFEEAMLAGNAEATTNLACLFYEGKGVKQDWDKAKELFEQAANHGQVRAMLYLGDMYEEGSGVPQDHATAVKYYAAAADKGDPVAQNILGVIYFNAQGVEADTKRAYNLFYKAALKGIAESQYYCGQCCEKGLGVEKDVKLASEWYKFAASQGYQEAIECLERLKTGQLVEER